MTNHTQATVEEVARLAVALEIWHRFADNGHIEWEDESHKAEYLMCADAILALPSVGCPADDPVGVVYQRLLWRHMEAARKDFHGARRDRIFKLINAFREEFPAECAAYEAQFPAPPQAGEARP